MRKAHLIKNGDGQAVRLPAEFCFDGDFVYGRRDELSGDVILSASSSRSWPDFVRLRDSLGPLEFELPRDSQAQDRDPLS